MNYGPEEQTQARLLGCHALSAASYRTLKLSCRINMSTKLNFELIEYATLDIKMTKYLETSNIIAISRLTVILQSLLLAKDHCPASHLNLIDSNSSRLGDTVDGAALNVQLSR